MPDPLPPATPPAPPGLDPPPQYDVIPNFGGTALEREGAARDELHAEADRIREQARGEYPASTVAILRGLGLQEPERSATEPPPIGQPVDIPSPQQDARQRLNLVIRQFMHAYDGDLAFTIRAVVDAIVAYGEDCGLDVADAGRQVVEQMQDHISRVDNPATSAVSSATQEDPNGDRNEDAADSRGADAGESHLHRREDRRYDASTGRARPDLIDF